MTCRLLMNILDQGGPKGVLASGLAIAGKTGTLADRFLESPARERLRGEDGHAQHRDRADRVRQRAAGPGAHLRLHRERRVRERPAAKLQETLGGDLVVYPQGPP